MSVPWTQSLRLFLIDFARVGLARRFAAAICGGTGPAASGYEPALAEGLWACQKSSARHSSAPSSVLSPVVRARLTLGHVTID